MHFGAGSLNRMVMRVMSGRPQLGWAGFKDVIWVKMRSAGATAKGKHISLVVSAAPGCSNVDTNSTLRHFRVGKKKSCFMILYSLFGEGYLPFSLS